MALIANIENGLISGCWNKTDCRKQIDANTKRINAYNDRWNSALVWLNEKYNQFKNASNIP